MGVGHLLPEAAVSTITAVLSGHAQWACVEADCAEVLPALSSRSVDHIIQDPPYGQHVHMLQRRLKVGSGGKATGNTHKVVSAPLDFAHLSAELRRSVAIHAARVARRWIITKSDMEGVADWKSELQRAGARWVRFGVWWKENAQPQLSGDRPGQGVEGIAIAHARGPRMRWNSGGKHGRWMHPVATDRNGAGERVHTAQTPLSLWLELVADFTEPGDLILDPFCGSGSLGIACVRLGRRYIGIDNGHDELGYPWAEVARAGLSAERHGLSRGAAAAGQLGLFAGAR
jgi:site-specific DNA-methyltransferase (adenine-specific)